MAWNEFSGCGRPYRLDFDALLAKSATDAAMLDAVIEAISFNIGAELQAKAAIAVVLKELAKEPFG